MKIVSAIRRPPTIFAKAIRVKLASCNCNCLGQETAKEPIGLRVQLPPANHTRWRLHTVSFLAKRHAGKLLIQIFIVVDVTRPRIEPESTVSEEDALSNRPVRTWKERFALLCIPKTSGSSLIGRLLT